jgi:dsDNA-specific endonuclease/ATPase MutS2
MDKLYSQSLSLVEETGLEDSVRITAAELRQDVPQLDLHGRYTSNIEVKIDQFLYQNYNKKEPSVNIIYGIGTGVLENATKNFLKLHPLVYKVLDKVGSCVVILET